MTEMFAMLNFMFLEVYIGWHLYSIKGINDKPLWDSSLRVSTFSFNDFLEIGGNCDEKSRRRRKNDVALCGGRGASCS